MYIEWKYAERKRKLRVELELIVLHHIVIAIQVDLSALPATVTIVFPELPTNLLA